MTPSPAERLARFPNILSRPQPHAHAANPLQFGRSNPLLGDGALKVRTLKAECLGRFGRGE